MEHKKEFKALAYQGVLITSLLEWRRHPEMSFRYLLKRHFVEFLGNATDNPNSKDLLYNATGFTMFNLLHQIFVSNYEYLRHNIDSKMTEKLKSLKTSASTTPNNFNTEKFLDVIRQSFVHNDINAEIPNWKLNDDSKIEINFKGNTFTFTFFELHQLMTGFLELKKEHTNLHFEASENKLYKLVKSNKLTVDNIPSLFVHFDNSGKVVNFDKFQKQALYNLFYEGQSLLGKQIRLNKLTDNNYYLFSYCFPMKANAGAVSRLNNICFRNLPWLNENFLNKNMYINACKQFEDEVTLIDDTSDSLLRQNLIEFMNYDTIIFEATLSANLLFSLFSLVPHSQLQPYFNEFEIDIRRLRNSLTHGRYYYNNCLGFEFYDGKNNTELEHIGMLCVDQICHIVSKFLNDTFTASKDITK